MIHDLIWHITRFGLRDYGVDLSPAELEQVFLYFDSSRDGLISVDEFLLGAVSTCTFMCMYMYTCVD